MPPRPTPWIAERRHSAGFGLLGVGLLLLALPLWMLGGDDHPLAGADKIDLCARLPAWPEAGTTLSAPLSPVVGSTGACNVVDEQDEVVVEVVLTSTRSLSADGAQRTSKLFDTWRKEVAASGVIGLSDVAGDWKQAIEYRNGASQQLLVEDDGILLLLQSRSRDAPALQAYGRAVAAALRSDAVSSSVSSPAAASPAR